MLEVLCRDAFRDACHDVVDRERGDCIVSLKGHPRPMRKYKNFFVGIDGILTRHWLTLPMKMFMVHRKEGLNLGSLAWIWMQENAAAVCEAYVRDRYGGKLENAMDAAQNFDDLFDQFSQYFEKRRLDFMAKTETALTEIRREVTVRGRTTSSHGAVANLLKVLTRTMKEQGSSIHSIAKMQYSVCLQAGIYLPEEFLTDILVAGEMIDEAADTGIEGVNCGRSDL